jgi:hypothetical protein
MIKSAFRWRCTVEIASQTSLRLTWGGYSASLASYMVQVEHSDGKEMLCYFSCIEEARFTFGKLSRAEELMARGDPTC